MNRKSKIIVSITGIVLVLLILVSLTYAYFLTRIQGNTNNKSVSVTTAYLELVYNDGNGIISASKIEPGTEIDEKTFSVTNTGNVSLSYGVYIEDVINEFERTEDLELTLTCTSNKANTDCDGISTIYPENNKKIISNDIAPSETQTYSLVLEYIEANVNQSVDMNKKLEGKVQIYGSERINLEFNIANSARGDYGILESTPKTSYATIDGSTGTYNFVGVEYGAHTLTIYDGNGSVKGTSPITIGSTSATEAEINETNITLPNNIEEVSIPVNNINIGLIELGEVALFEKNIPYKVGTLANKIVHNAMHITDEEKALKYAEFRKTPITKPGQEKSRQKYEKNDGLIEIKTQSNITTTNTFTYASDYTENTTNGKFTLTNSTSGVYSEIYESLVGKYIVSVTGSDSEATSSNLANIYKVISTTSNSIRYGSVSPYVSDEQVLSITEDDYGDSYYFRGGVTNNYLNFAGMCWRIVRILGDGSIKLILEDQYTSCNDNIENDINNDEVYYTGNWNLGRAYYGFSNNSTLGYYYPDYKNGGMANKFYNFQETTSINGYKQYLKKGDWCKDETLYKNHELIDKPSSEIYTDSNYYYSNYGSLERISNNKPSLKCFGDIDSIFKSNDEKYVDTITAEEGVFAGLIDANNSSNYLINDYAKSNLISFAISSLHYFNSGPHIYQYYISYGGNLSRVISNGNGGVYGRPAIQLKVNIPYVSGNGSLDHPYEVE